MNAGEYLPDSHLFTELSHGTCHYRLDGPEDGEPILLIHGATVPAWEFDRLVPYLTDIGYRTIRADLYGHGYSARPDTGHDINLFRQQMIELLDHLEIQSPINILGHSLGSVVAASLATHFPERCIKILLAAPLIDFSGQYPLLQIFSIPMLGELLTRYYLIPMLLRRRTKRYQNIEDGQFVGKFKSQLLTPGFDKSLLSLIRNSTLGSHDDIYCQLNQSGHEVRIIRGEDDNLVSKEQIHYLSNLMANASYVEIKATDHAFLLTHPEKVSPVIHNYISQSS